MLTDASLTATSSAGEPIAIVGIGCRFPGGANSPAAFWDLMIHGRDAIVDVPKDRWNTRRFYDPDPNKPGKMYMRAGGFLQERIDQFDALFFGISPREATCLDPQQRFLLEVTWEALEDAGLVPDQLAGSETGVYIGAFMLDNMMTHMCTMNRDLIGAQTAVSSMMTVLSNRLSYTFDLHGPSLSIDTACSSSLVALHYACQAIWHGECQQALAGGVNIMFRPEYAITLSKGQFLSPDGHCKSFDERADGYARAEGAGIVVLKPLADALQAGDSIYALVRGTGVNQDGRTNGITVPNPQSQASLIQKVCHQAGVSPRQIRYVEAHGTGTPVGDPIEAEALGTALGQGRPAHQRCVVGSLKANMGHLEAAAGIAGAIKAALCLKHQQIPPLANLQKRNPKIPFDELGLRLPHGLEPMPPGEGPALVAINSFGYGGTNAHVLLQEYEPVDQHNGKATQNSRTEDNGRPHLLPISARSQQALRDLAGRYATRLTEPEAPSLRDLCFSASLRRGHHRHRFAVTADSPSKMAEQLRSFVDRAQGPSQGTAADAGQDKPVFVFTGMGPQWWAMGRELLEKEPVFRQTVEACDRLFQQLAGWSILAEMTAQESQSRIGETQIAQPAIFVLQVALTQLWRSWGIEPAAIVGHSVGEVAAAHVAGALSLEDAIRVIYHRSRIQKKAAGQGRMLAVGLSEEDAQAVLSGHAERVSIAAINSHSALTLSGDADALSEIAATLEDGGVFNRFLQVEVAYHSPLMDPLLDEVMESLETLNGQAPRVTLYSTVTGSTVQEASHDATYWCRNIRRPVLFAKTMDQLFQDGYRLFLEVGPHPVLSTSIKECLRRRDANAVVLTSLRRKEPERQTMFQALGDMYTAGYPVDWKRLDSQGGSFVRLPSYPWQREEYWHESDEALQDRIGEPDHPLLGQRVSSPNAAWESQINANFLPYLHDHQVEGLVVLPGAAYVETALALHQQLNGQDVDGEGARVLEDLRFHKALIVDDGDEPVLQMSYNEQHREFSIHSRTRDDKSNWTLHATGKLSFAPVRPPESISLAEIQSRCDETPDVETVYAELAERGLRYGPYFQGLRRLWRRPGEVLAEIQGHPELASADEYLLHPTLLDATFQSLITALDASDSDANTNLYIPVSIRQIRLHASPPERFWSHGRLLSNTAGSIEGDITLCDEHGQVFAEVRGLLCQAIADKTTKMDRFDQWTYQFSWEEANLNGEVSGSGRWLLFMDDQGIGKQLSQQLQSAGVEATIQVSTGVEFRQENATSFQIRRDSQEDLQQLMAAANLDQCQGVAYLWGLDEPTDSSDPTGTARAITGLQVIQAVASADPSTSPRLYIATRGAQQVSAQEQNLSLAQAPLVGLARVAANEHPDMRCTLVDLDANEHADLAVGLARELLADSPEDDVALRGADRYVHRLVRCNMGQAESTTEQLAAANPDHSFELELGEPGNIESLCFRRQERTDPGPGEVEIEIRASAIHFNDKLKATKMLSEQAIDNTLLGDALGKEVSGVVVRVGDNVADLEVGDEVVAVLAETFRRYVTVRAGSVFALPKLAHVNHVDSAALPLAFSTAYYGLYHVARLQPGERVLIHAETSGVGIAAIQVARWIGANVFATAGSSQQRDYLRSLGIEHVMDSQSLDFADEVLSETRGEGVDVILSCLSGELTDKNVSILAPFGRLVELGTRDVQGNRHRSVLPADRDLTFASVDIQRMMEQRPDRFRLILNEVWQHFRDGHFEPLPVNAFPAVQAAGAFQAMTEAPWIGKIVIDWQAPDRLSLLPLRENSTRIRPDGTYLITGGFGGFGLAIAKWLVAQGARSLVLVGRRGAATAEAQQTVQELEAAGAQVMAVAVDVSQPAPVAQLMEDIASSMPPLRGILHTAGILDDDLLVNLDASRLAKVMAPKAGGAWHLHEQTQDLPLDFFVLFSSVSALIGNVRQGNYVAANLFLDSLAHDRRAAGLPATSINWGVLADVGMAANANVEEQLERIGIKSFTAPQAMEALGRVLDFNPIQIGVMDLDWEKWRQFDPVAAKSPRVSQLVQANGQVHAESGQALLRQQLRELDQEAQQEKLANLLAEQLANTLRMPVEKVDLHQPLPNMGVDSLMATELRSMIELRMGLEISTLELMKGNTLSQLAKRLVKKMGLGDADTSTGPAAIEEDQPDPTPNPSDSPEQVLADLEELGDDEVEALLDAMLTEQEAAS